MTRTLAVRIVALAALPLLSIAPSASAAEGNPAAEASSTTPHRVEGAAAKQTVAINPVFIPFGTLSAEYERALFSPMTSLGVSGWYEYKDVRARWIYLKAMVYPWGVALRGFGVGPTFGVVRAYRAEGDVGHDENDTTPTFGLMAQYDLPFGPDDLFLAGFGLGGRIALKDLSDRSPLPRFDGDARLVLGMAF